MEAARLPVEFFTSFLFLLPAYYACVALPWKDVTVACLLCLVTSLLNHGCGMCKVADRIIVNGIAAAYVLHAVLTMGVAALPLCGLAALAVLAYTCVPDGMHFIVHVVAVGGILEYIRIRSRLLSY